MWYHPRICVVVRWVKRGSDSRPRWLMEEWIAGWPWGSPLRHVVHRAALTVQDSTYKARWKVTKSRTVHSREELARDRVGRLFDCSAVLHIDNSVARPLRSNGSDVPRTRMDSYRKQGTPHARAAASRRVKTMSATPATTNHSRHVAVISKTGSRQVARQTKWGNSRASQTRNTHATHSPLAVFTFTRIIGNAC